MGKRVLITGASGCIGHYVVEHLLQHTDHELYLIVRNSSKLGFDWTAFPQVHLLQADLRDLGKFSELLSTIEIAILIATAWGGTEVVFQVNVHSTIALMQQLNLEVCEQIIYFSTASVLDRDNQLLPQAGEIGIDYIRSKYECLNRLLELRPNLPPIRFLFPTLVLGGDEKKPYSHLSAGISEVTRWIFLIRWLKTDASFHFIHGADVAQMVTYFVQHPPKALPKQSEPEYFVLGNHRITVNQAVEETCDFFSHRIYFRFNLSLWLANLIIVVFRIQMAEWDRFCLNYRHFTYQNVVSPRTFGLTGYCETFTDALKDNLSTKNKGG
ncbi:MAG: NAD-dependent epimerase/dehydratase family protein [Microcoleaceae cyanobacterium]